MKANTALASVASTANVAHATSVWTSRAFAGARLLLSFVLFFGIANAVFHLVPQPPLPAAALTFMGGLFSAPYFFALLKGTELLVALALLSNRFVPLALVVLAPITVNIVLFHFVLAPAGAPLAAILLVLHLATAWSRRENYRTVLAFK
jgi:hypothetical protein